MVAAGADGKSVDPKWGVNAYGSVRKDLVRIGLPGEPHRYRNLHTKYGRSKFYIIHLYIKDLTREGEEESLTT